MEIDNIKDILVYYVGGSICIADAATTMLGHAYNQHHIKINQILTSDDQRAMVLFAYPGIWNKLLIFGPTQVGLKGQIAQFFTEHDTRCYFRDNAKAADLEEVIKNPGYQSVALIGHGSREGWRAADRPVFVEEVEEWSKDAEQKEGFFLQMTCGDKKGKVLGSPIMKYPERCLGYDRPIRLFSYINAFNKIKPLV